MKLRFVAVILIICLAAGILSGCGRAAADITEPGTSSQSGMKDGKKPGGSGTGSPASAGGILTDVSSYAELLKLLEDRSDNGTRHYHGLTVTDDAIPVMDAGDVPKSESNTEVANFASDPSASSSDYSSTNVQVEGIDEDDIVKTDGRYIYVLDDNELRIFSAGGENTSLISSVTVTDEPYWNSDDDGNYSSRDEYTRGMYICGSKVAVLSDSHSYREYMEDDRWRWEDTDVARLRIYDVSDPSSPDLVASLGQDGSNFSSRLIGNTLYLISRYYIYDYDTEDPDDCIPRLYTENDSRLIEPGCISILPRFSSTEYTIAVAYDLNDCKMISDHSILGGVDQVYMTADNLYIATSSGVETESEPYTESIYKVVDHFYEQRTAIVRIALDGNLEPAASGEVTGYLDSQFSLDEYDGYLRLVTTSQENAYSVYTDEERGWSNYKWEDRENGNNLFVLDADLSVVSSITDIAKGEMIYSARFFGDTGYFVTFRNTDPLFAVDLSDPSSPKIIGELKLPGFSDYLHGWSDGRLLGLGMDADEDTGFTEGMKLSMFDISDPRNLSEKHSLKLDTSYSEALYNHKAILVSPDRGPIAFPADGGYSIYSYDDAEGFRLVAETLRDDDWYYDSDCRGLFIGQYFYVTGGGRLTVLEMDTYSAVAVLDY